MVRGPLGFEAEQRFLLMQKPEQFPLVYLQSIRTPDLCFLALPVLAVQNGYRLDLPPDDAELIGLPASPQIGSDVLCLAFVTVHDDGPTANLLAPVVVNLRTRAALQCINGAEDYSHQHPLAAAAEGVAA
jgi:flagellar assembly factor FliW